jgi:anaerobic selenocysteine-containing dehydrogenase
MGISVQQHGTVCQWAIQMLNVLTGHLDTEGGSMFSLPAVDLVFGPNSKPGHFGAWTTRVRQLPEFGGELPCAALAEEILTPGEGQIRALVTCAGNPVLSTPNGSQLETALASLEFMVAIDIYLNETTQYADVILPPTSPLEHDHYDLALLPFAVRNTAKYSAAVFAKPEGALHDWEIFAQLGKRVAQLQGTQPLPDFEPAQLLDMGLRAGPYGVMVGHQPGLTLADLRANVHGVDLGAHQSCLPARLYHADKRIPCVPAPLVQALCDLAAQPAINVDDMQLIGRRHVRSNNSWLHNAYRLMKGKPRHQAQINAQDAHRLGIVSGDRVRIESRVGAVEVDVEVTDALMMGVISIPHGWGHHRPGIGLSVAGQYPGVSVNDLTDEQWLDTVSGNAAFNGVPVRLTKLKSGPDEFICT